uniref:Uncharacterized protein n=1 Tax=Arundo donax TaxID=35708 RepID=A0A0A9E635_ARUDO
MHLKCLRCFQSLRQSILPFFPSPLPKATNLHLPKPHQLHREHRL